MRLNTHPPKRYPSTSKLSPAVLTFLVIFGVLFGLSYGCNACGTGGFGPTTVTEVTVDHLWVDHSEEGSHYMVGTDQGAFEIDNGIVLGVQNADELYGKLQVNRKYRLTAKGKRYQNIFLHEYPYITKIELLE